jgi:hypothetical protein
MVEALNWTNAEAVDLHFVLTRATGFGGFQGSRRSSGGRAAARSQPALNALLAEWTSEAGYAARVARLTISD